MIATGNRGLEAVYSGCWTKPKSASTRQGNGSADWHAKPGRRQPRGTHDRGSCGEPVGTVVLGPGPSAAELWKWRRCAPWKSRTIREIPTFPQLRRRSSSGGTMKKTKKNSGQWKSGNPQPGFPLSHRPDRLRRKEKSTELQIDHTGPQSSKL